MELYKLACNCENITFSAGVGTVHFLSVNLSMSVARAIQVQLDMLGAALEVLRGNFEAVGFPPVAADEEKHHCFVTPDVRVADPHMAAFLPDATLTLMSFLAGESRVSGPYVEVLVKMGEDRLRHGIRTCRQVEECGLAWCMEDHRV